MAATSVHSDQMGITYASYQDEFLQGLWNRMATWWHDTWMVWALAGVLLIVALAVGAVLHAVLFRLLAAVASRTSWKADDLLVERLKRPSRPILPLLVLMVLLPLLPGVAEPQLVMVQRFLQVGIILTAVWMGTVCLQAGREVARSAAWSDVADNLELRRMHTQLTVLTRMGVVLLWVIGIALTLIVFPRMREVGAGLLASAGLLGLIAGLSARPLLENIVAGLQIALTQPIRLDDVVIIRGEWGRIEEITATYVVVRIWDQRRLIVPFSKIIQEPFENWTRRSSDILGTVIVHADYTVPVEDVRQELSRIVAAHEAWDGRVCVLQVTDATDRTVQLRALVSAKDAGKAWELRVHVREKLIEYLQRELPECLPLQRLELSRGVTAPCRQDRQQDRQR